MTAIEIIKEEITHKAKIMRECRDNNDQENSEYRRAWVHGAKFALEVIRDKKKEETK